MLPESVAVIIECQTDNRLRTLADIRYILKDFGGTVTPTNHMFDRVGKILLQGNEDTKEEDIFDYAIEAGAVDVETAPDQTFIVYTSPQQTASSAETLTQLTELQVLSAEIVWSPKDESITDAPPNGFTESLIGTTYRSS